MKQVIFSTGNEEKFTIAQATCAKYGIELIQKKADIVEIQSEDPEVVAIDKSAKAYALFGEPLVVNDDSWAFLGLRGFPGIYMHYVNDWFTAEDFLRLASGLTDRRVVLTQYVIYQDKDVRKIFKGEVKGELLTEPRGNSPYSNHTIITLEGDNGFSIAEAYNPAADQSARRAGIVWKEFAQWFRTHNSD